VKKLPAFENLATVMSVNLIGKVDSFHAEPLTAPWCLPGGKKCHILRVTAGYKKYTGLAIVHTFLTLQLQ